MMSVIPVSKHSSNKVFLNTLKGNNSDAIPLWLMRQAGRYLPEYREIRKNAGSFLNLCYTPEFATEVTLQPIRRFGFDAAILFSDILVVPDALGCKVSFTEGEGPRLETITDESALSHLSLDNFLKHLSPVFQTVQNLAQELPKQTALIGFAGSPWTVATYMVEGKTSKQFEKIRHLSYASPDFFHKLIRLLVDATSLYLKEQIKHGAEVVQLFDSWSGVLPEIPFKQWVIEPTKHIVANIKAAYPDVPIIGFPKGAGINLLKYINETGVDAVGIDYTLPLEWVRDSVQTHLPVQGNLDPVLLAADKTAMKQQVEKILATFGNKPFIFNLGHGILPHTPIEHVELLVETVRNWKR
jgi:uroporphyrinogen decarboxylase